MPSILRRGILYVFILSFCMISASAFAQTRPRHATQPTEPAPPIRLFVDATQAPEKILHARLEMAVSPGDLELVYPEWIPGEHGPTGPIVDLTGVEFFSHGQRITWHRDLRDMYLFHLTIPQGPATLHGAATLQVQLDFVMPAPPEGFSAGASSTAQLDVLSWNQVLLYPYQPGMKADDVRYTASLKLPGGWHYDTALPVDNDTGSEVNFKTVLLTELVDSPVLAGRHFRRIPLTPDGPIQHFLDLAADSEAALQMPAETVEEYKNLVAETGALFGVRHYRDYHFLLTLSDHVAHFGLEHHESSDDRVDERTMIDDDERWLAAGLLPHEMTHSWNGKYRRPKGLATPNYQEPMEGDLLWVYEGLTEYLGYILTVRSGLWTKQQFLEETADAAAGLDHTPGRNWRPLQDTADAAQVLYNAPPEFENWRRGVDFYEEGFLIWLDVDTAIRQQTSGQKSMNDFCRLFYDGQNTSPMVKPYTFEDVVNTLNQVVPYDWRKFLRERLDTYGPGAPLGGIINGGWKLVYDENPSEFTRTMERVRRDVDARFSIGLSLDDKGAIRDVIMNSIAWSAGIAPGMEVVAVNGRKYTPELLREALQAAKGNGPNIELLVTNGDFYKTCTLNYHDGEKYAHLVRNDSKPDILSEIIKPLKQ